MKTKRKKIPPKKDEIVVYELAMPVFKAGANLHEAQTRATDQSPAYAARDALALSAGCWAEGAAILLRLHAHWSDRLAQCDALGVEMDWSYEADGHSIVVSGPGRTLRPVLRDRLLRDWLVKLEGDEK